MPSRHAAAATPQGPALAVLRAGFLAPAAARGVLAGGSPRGGYQHGGYQHGGGR